ncbi:hypothetical protein VP01_3180g1 [Puccinia sorghi]|uniref:Uncharacterized protein n=1 Tax=Puccinia sorghi TaxID=27349 RepID=A0A0L6V0H7_9BASI|nr:hypothetical protein VP01_3180g1 [Puccinia sorghi]
MSSAAATAETCSHPLAYISSTTLTVSIVFVYANTAYATATTAVTIICVHHKSAHSRNLTLLSVLNNVFFFFLPQKNWDALKNNEAATGLSIGRFFVNESIGFFLSDIQVVKFVNQCRVCVLQTCLSLFFCFAEGIMHLYRATCQLTFFSRMRATLKSLFPGTQEHIKKDIQNNLYIHQGFCHGTLMKVLSLKFFHILRVNTSFYFYFFCFSYQLFKSNYSLFISPRHKQIRTTGSLPSFSAPPCASLVPLQFNTPKAQHRVDPVVCWFTMKKLMSIFQSLIFGELGPKFRIAKWRNEFDYVKHVVILYGCMLWRQSDICGQRGLLSAWGRVEAGVAHLLRRKKRELAFMGYLVGLSSSSVCVCGRVFQRSTRHQLTQTKVLFFQLSHWTNTMNFTIRLVESQASELNQVIETYEKVCFATKSLFFERVLLVCLSFCDWGCLE